MTTIPENEQAGGRAAADLGHGSWPVGHDGAGVAGVVRAPRHQLVCLGQHRTGDGYGAALAFVIAALGRGRLAGQPG